MEKRRCDECEYYKVQEYTNALCLLEPTRVGEHGRSHRSTTKADEYCQHWEPIRSDNPVAQEAWEMYQMTMKLIKEGKEGIG